MPSKKNRVKTTSKSIKKKLNYWVIRLQSQGTIINIAVKEITEAINTIVPVINELIQAYEFEISELKAKIKVLESTTKPERADKSAE